MIAVITNLVAITITQSVDEEHVMGSKHFNSY